MSIAPVITWSPTTAQVQGSRLWGFLRWVEEHHGISLTDYGSAWAWSVAELDAFWGSVWEYFEVIGDGYSGVVLGDRSMPGADWFPGTTLNWAENILRHARDPKRAAEPAIVSMTEDDASSILSWADLEARVASLAKQLRLLGVEPGARVAGVLPNIPETIIAVLATASIGAIWTVSSPDLSAAGTLDRLRQLEPVVLIGVDGYRFNGVDLDKREHLLAVRAALPTVKHTIVVSALGLPVDGALDFATLAGDAVEPSYLRVPFAHPLWVLFSSGTTGAPKGIVHSHGGITIESYKGNALQQDLGATDRFYVAANTSWMIWNLLVNTLISGASIVTYAGSPTWRRPDRQLEVVALTRTTAFGVGAAYLALIEKAGTTPAHDLDLSALRSMQATGSPLPPGTWAWVHEAIKADVHLGSDTGGTDICSGFIGSNPMSSVYLGELQAPFLGVAVQAWSDEGVARVGEVGEMVITEPMPSMPVFFWGDSDGSRYRSAYFEKFPGVWSQGDWITETVRGSFVVHGRSDATLNRGGVRLGSSDIYAAVDTMPEIRGSLVVGVELAGGGYYLPLFVVLAAGAELDDALRERISHHIRERSSARHVPDEIVAVPAIPVSHAGKRMELPVKRLLAGIDEAKAVNRSTLANPDSMDWFVEFARERADSPARA